jgi:hypothetical protein
LFKRVERLVPTGFPVNTEIGVFSFIADLVLMPEQPDKAKHNMQKKQTVDDIFERDLKAIGRPLDYQLRR